MDINVNVNGKITLDAPELMSVLQGLTKALTGVTSEAVRAEPQKERAQLKQEEFKPSDPESDSAADSENLNTDEPEPEPTLEQIRALAATKGKANKAAVKELLEKYGAVNLTALRFTQYGAFYSELGAI